MKSLRFVLTVLAAASTSALNFDCRFVEVPWMAIGLNYQCQTKPLNVEASQHLTSISGAHLDNKTNHDVLGLHISNCTDLTYIPKGLLDIFPNLIGIYLDGCGISSLDGTELYEYQQLELFALELSPLYYVPGNLFAHNSEMLLISFSDNKINSTGRDLLRNLNKLSEVYFENNICINGNASTVEEVPEFNEQLNLDCSISSAMIRSVYLTFALSGFSYFGKYNWID